MDFTSRVVEDVLTVLTVSQRMSGHGPGTIGALGPLGALASAVTQALLVLGITRTEDRAVLDEEQLGLITDVFRGILGLDLLGATGQIEAAGAEQIEQITKAFSVAVQPVPWPPGSMVADNDKKRKRGTNSRGADSDPDSASAADRREGAQPAAAVQRAKRSVGLKKRRADALTCALTQCLLVRPVTLPSGKSFSLGHLVKHFETCKAQRKDRTCPLTRRLVPSDWTPIENTDLRDMTEGLVREITDEAAEETVPEAAAEWTELLGACAEYDATVATVSTEATVATVAIAPLMVEEEPSALGPGPDDFTLCGCTVETLNYPGRKFLVTGRTENGSFSVTELPISARSATLTAAECFLMAVHVTPEAKNKNKRIKIVFNKHREPPGGSYSGAVQRLIGLTGLTGVIAGFDQDNAIVKADHDGSVLVVPLRHCALYIA
jgi:hypothetical protein